MHFELCECGTVTHYLSWQLEAASSVIEKYQQKEQFSELIQRFFIFWNDIVGLRQAFTICWQCRRCSKPSQIPLNMLQKDSPSCSSQRHNNTCRIIPSILPTSAAPDLVCDSELLWSPAMRRFKQCYKKKNSNQRFIKSFVIYINCSPVWKYLACKLSLALMEHFLCRDEDG